MKRALVVEIRPKTPLDAELVVNDLLALDVYLRRQAYYALYSLRHDKDAITRLLRGIMKIGKKITGTELEENFDAILEKLATTNLFTFDVKHNEHIRVEIELTPALVYAYLVTTSMSVPGIGYITGVKSMDDILRRLVDEYFKNTYDVVQYQLVEGGEPAKGTS